LAVSASKISASTHDPGLNGHLLPGQAAGIALSVHALVVAPGVLRHFAQVCGPRQRLEHLDRGDDVMVDRFALLLGERAAGDRQVLDLVLVEKIRTLPRDVGPLAAVPTRATRSCDSADMTSPPMFAWRRNSRSLSKLAYALLELQVDLRGPLRTRRPAPELELALEGLDLEIAPEHLEARVHQIESGRRSSPAWCLVHNVEPASSPCHSRAAGRRSSAHSGPCRSS